MGLSVADLVWVKDDGPDVADVFPAPERLIRGPAAQQVWVHYADPSGAYCVGIWACQDGAWRVQYTEHEYCQMLQGLVRLTDDQGASVDLKAGDCFVIPAGFTGTWDVLEPARKVFALYEPSAVAEGTQ